jgi:hypothetical protein
MRVEAAVQEIIGLSLEDETGFLTEIVGNENSELVLEAFAFRIRERHVVGIGADPETHGIGVRRRAGKSQKSQC